MPRRNRAGRNSGNNQAQGESPASSDRARAHDRRHPWLPPAAPGLDRLLARNYYSAHRRDAPTPAQNWDPTSPPLDRTGSHALRWTYRTAIQLQLRDRADRHRRRRDYWWAWLPPAP